MLRFAVISLSTLGVLGLVFYFVVLHAQPPAVATGSGATPVLPTTVPATQASSSMVGPGFKPWAKNFEDGKLTSMFTAMQFNPQTNGSFQVDHPVSIFYLDKGQYLKVTGENGIVNCDTPTPKGAAAGVGSGGLFSAPTSSPKNGTLRHVRAELFANEAATKPTEWMETDNIHFDNETLPTMFTESYVDAQGNTIAADQVPVMVRGDEYEFDGNGLTLVWNAEKRLEKLEIYHGKRLEIINPSKLSLPGMSPTVSDESSSTSSEKAHRAAVSPHGSAVGFHAVEKSVEPPIPYRAVFHDRVKVGEAARTMATADSMTVDFLKSDGKPKATTAPAKVSTNPPPASASLVAEKPPTTKAINGPVTVYWTGTLVVTPLKGQPMMPLAPGQSIVRLIGSPVRLTPEGSEVTAASATIRYPDAAVQLEHSAEYPLVHLTQTKGLMLSTGSIDYDPATAYAILSGPSALSVPVDKSPMNVSWSQQGVLHVVPLHGQPYGVDHVDLVGDVAVAHPLFGLNSHELQLDLNLIPKSRSNHADEQLRLLTAIDNVTCQLTAPDGVDTALVAGESFAQFGEATDGNPKQEIDADLLKIRTEPTADRQNVFPREVVADGRVHAFDPDKSITAGHLDAMLLAKAGPATKASPDDIALESLFASTDVHALMKGNTTADADQLRITTVDGKQQVDLWGPNGVKLNNGKGTRLAGQIVHLVPDRKGVSVEGPGSINTILPASTTKAASKSPPRLVDGPGSMKTIRPASPTKAASKSPPRPIDISWTDSMSMDGIDNIADMLGNVTVKNIDAGTVSTVTGDKAHIDLVDTPKNSTQATSPDDMGGKQVKLLTLTGHVVGKSDLNDLAGAPLRRERLLCEKLIDNADDRTVTIPGPGEMFMEDHKADPKHSSTLGQMAIQWSKQLVYDQNTDRITIDGDTLVGFEKDPKAGQPAKPGPPMQLYSQQLVITLVKAAATTGPQLSHMQSTGQVHFLADGINLLCSTMDFDPQTSIMTLCGTPQQPGRAMNANQKITGYFDKLDFNVKTEEVLDAPGLKGTVRW